MKQNKFVIPAAIILILAVALFMAYDFFGGSNSPEKNVYEYNLDNFEQVDPSLICYSEIQSFHPEIEIIRALAIDQDDQIYVTGKNKLQIFDKTGNLLKEFNTETEAMCMAVDEAKNIYIGAKDHVDIWSSDGELKSSWKIDAEKPFLTSIIVNENSAFIADAGNKIIYHLDLEGNILNEIGRKDSIQGIEGFIIPSPFFDVALGREGELWAVNSGRHQLESYDAEGNLKYSWKKTSMELDGFSGCCNPSHIAILSNGSFVTSEKGIVRVKIHKPSGEFECVVAAPKDFEKGTKGLDLAVDSEDRIIVLDPKKGLIRIFERNKN